MKIENGMLITKIGADDVIFVLPVASIDAKVKAWSVPKNYRSDGLFVAITLPGQAEDVPACNLADTQYLGELMLMADAEKKLEAAKIARLGEINKDCDEAVSALAHAYPESEVRSWPQQVKEAESLAANPAASAPLLTAIAYERSISVVDLVDRVLTKMTAYAGASGTLIGRRQAAEDLIALAITHDDISAIAW